MTRWFVNVGDGDNLTVNTETLAEVEKAVETAGFGGMINAVVREGHEPYLVDWKALAGIIPWARRE